MHRRCIQDRITGKGGLRGKGGAEDRSIDDRLTLWIRILRSLTLTPLLFKPLMPFRASSWSSSIMALSIALLGCLVSARKDGQGQEVRSSRGVSDKGHKRIPKARQSIPIEALSGEWNAKAVADLRACREKGNPLVCERKRPFRKIEMTQGAEMASSQPQGQGQGDEISGFASGRFETTPLTTMMDDDAFSVVLHPAGTLTIGSLHSQWFLLPPLLESGRLPSATPLSGGCHAEEVWGKALVGERRLPAAAFSCKRRGQE